MTFQELAGNILSRPDCRVEIPDAYIGSTHAFVNAAKDYVNTCENPKQDSTAYMHKKNLRQIWEKIASGDINPKIFPPIRLEVIK